LGFVYTPALWGDWGDPGGSCFLIGASWKAREGKRGKEAKWETRRVELWLLLLSSFLLDCKSGDELRQKVG